MGSESNPYYSLRLKIKNKSDLNLIVNHQLFNELINYANSGGRDYLIISIDLRLKFWIIWIFSWKAMKFWILELRKTVQIVIYFEKWQFLKLEPEQRKAINQVMDIHRI